MPLKAQHEEFTRRTQPTLTKLNKVFCEALDYYYVDFSYKYEYQYQYQYQQAPKNIHMYSNKLMRPFSERRHTCLTPRAPRVLVVS